MDHRKILLADDEEDIKTIVKFYLEGLGYQTVTAFDGLDAISTAETEKPDVILLDAMMPVIDGFEVLRRLKGNPDTKHIPVIMLSAASQAALVEKAMALGARDYIAKPFEPSKLGRALEAAIAESSTKPVK